MANRIMKIKSKTAPQLGCSARGGESFPGGYVISRQVRISANQQSKWRKRNIHDSIVSVPAPWFLY